MMDGVIIAYLGMALVFFIISFAWKKGKDGEAGSMKPLAIVMGLISLAILSYSYFFDIDLETAKEWGLVLLAMMAPMMFATLIK